MFHSSIVLRPVIYFIQVNNPCCLCLKSRDHMEGCFLSCRQTLHGWIFKMHQRLIPKTYILAFSAIKAHHTPLSWYSILNPEIAKYSYDFVLFPILLLFSKLPHLSKLFWHAFRMVCMCHKDRFITSVIIIFLSLSVPEEGKAKKKWHELSASPLLMWALLKRMVEEFQSHFALPTQCTSALGWGEKGRGSQSQETEMIISEMRKHVSALKRTSA